ncbi:uncharacterized protein DUF4625 [Pontibacter ummariensis]|uniref:EF hand n=1 Tax=Pontibacter ummariensis TaxID=1610492 RepID=A0A239I2V9_9BACT|nr:DUF4625 domain-containing protein [Pontibacter ummariensis]PRY10194.1 uncharacterized protein DUF4625 [Pontibacter ummariensis]SNS87849.1 protein of unknown function [Pontibacter ummariensis]
MKKFNWLFLFLFSFAFVACDDDDDIELDTVDPVINITNPAENAVFTAGDEFEMTADITDNMGLEEVRVFVTGPNGTRLSQFDEEISDFLNDNRNYDLDLDYTLPEDATPGAYVFTVEAEDEAGNIAEQVRNVTVNAAQMDAAGFNSVFAATSWFEDFDANDDTSLDEDEFGGSFFSIADMDDNDAISQTEFNDFAAAFGMETANFTAWDTDSNGSLSQEEFMTGLSGTEMFSDFDADNNDMVNEQELTDGIFGLWDDDGDDFLSDDEFTDRFDTFFGE